MAMRPAALKLYSKPTKSLLLKINKNKKIKVPLQFNLGDRTKRNSNERMVRSKSAGRINVKVERRTMSPSPIGIKETPHFLHEDKEKIKITKNHTSRSEK